MSNLDNFGQPENQYAHASDRGLEACGFDRRLPVFEMYGEQFGLSLIAEALASQVTSTPRSIRFVRPAMGQLIEQAFHLRPLSLRRAWPVRDDHGQIESHKWVVEGPLCADEKGFDSIRVLLEPTSYQGREEFQYCLGQLYRADPEPDVRFHELAAAEPIEPFGTPPT